MATRPRRNKYAAPGALYEEPVFLEACQWAQIALETDGLDALGYVLEREFFQQWRASGEDAATRARVWAQLEGARAVLERIRELGTPPIKRRG